MTSHTVKAWRLMATSIFLNLTFPANGSSKRGLFMGDFLTDIPSFKAPREVTFLIVWAGVSRTEALRRVTFSLFGVDFSQYFKVQEKKCFWCIYRSVEKPFSSIQLDNAWIFYLIFRRTFQCSLMFFLELLASWKLKWLNYLIMVSITVTW